MAFDKLIDALNEFRGEYVRELTKEAQPSEEGLIASGNLGESIKLDAYNQRSSYSGRYTVCR